ncbi:MAG: tellurite resistance TerB family protein [Hyphomicrobiaceae bacterium]
MFDAKSLIEALVAGNQRSAKPSASRGGGDLGSILGQLLPGLETKSDTNDKGGLGGLEDMLKNVLGEPSIKDAGNSSSSKTSESGDALGGLGDLLGQVLEQGTSGVKEGAGKVNDATGVGDVLNDLVAKYGGGRTTDELIAQAKEIMAENKLGTGAALGGLGALILGTQSGRSVAMSAAKIGALALIGGLAYKAYQNHQSGRPLITTQVDPEPAPDGSGFEADATSNDDAVLYVRAMIAGAGADGRIDTTEQKSILAGLSKSGLNSQAEEFIANEMNDPASASDLAAHVRTPEQAVKVYTAARIAINPDTHAERGFLRELATRLGIEQGLAEQIDAAARNVA